MKMKCSTPAEYCTYKAINLIVQGASNHSSHLLQFLIGFVGCLTKLNYYLGLTLIIFFWWLLVVIIAALCLLVC
jgi:hypothetical protein